MDKRKNRKPPSPPPLQKKQGWGESAHAAFSGVEAFFLSAAKSTRIGAVEAWISSFFRPESACVKEGGPEPAIVRSAGELAAVYLIYALINFATAAYLFYFSGISKAAAYVKGYTIPDPTILAANTLLLGPIVDVIVWFAVVSVAFLFAKLLGGKATYAKHVAALARVFCGSSIILSLLMVPMFAVTAFTSGMADYTVPGMILAALGFLVMLAAMLSMIAIFIYTLYGYFVVIRDGHSVSAVRAVSIILLVVAFALSISLFLKN